MLIFKHLKDAWIYVTSQVKQDDEFKLSGEQFLKNIHLTSEEFAFKTLKNKCAVCFFFYLREGFAEREPTAQSDHSSQLLLRCQSCVERQRSTLKKQSNASLVTDLLFQYQQRRNDLSSEKQRVELISGSYWNNAWNNFLLCDPTNQRFVHS